MSSDSPNSSNYSDDDVNDDISLRLTVAKKCSSAIINEVENELDPKKTEVLDFACGTGLISQELCSHVKSIIGIDISQAVVNEYNKKVWQQGIEENEMKAICLELKESEGDQLNGKKFDLVVCTSAYHHIDDIASITRILASYLKPSGKLIILDLIKDPSTSGKFHIRKCKNHGEKHGGKHGEHGEKHGEKHGEHGEKHGEHGEKHGEHGEKHGEKHGEHGEKHGKHGEHGGKHGEKYGHGENEDCVIHHKGGFDPKEIEKVFLETETLEDVKVEVAFNFNKFIKEEQKEYTFEYLIAKGKRKNE